ncbi:hypothetical protein E2562_012023 [Oryza meyeriana var. granulata]|uniref:Uncharacterized protein n=1 Tax=Oryza meyeriana var. granulata TaxID=110450 RepID=A0A6G1D2B0_9ORYZ|nr:hypothetical protein E2562_012023 [Oryza meyeriana var. granulata]
MVTAAALPADYTLRRGCRLMGGRTHAPACPLLVVGASKAWESTMGRSTIPGAAEMLFAATFTGAASVLIDVSAPTRFLVLNAADLAIDRASICFQDLAPTGVSLFEEDEILVLEFGGELPLDERQFSFTTFSLSQKALYSNSFTMGHNDL